MGKLTKVLIGSDIHWPYEDPRAYALFCKVIKQWQPDCLILNGDILDLYSVSAHDKDPRRVSFLEDEIDYANQKLDELDALTRYGARKFFLFGNHEWRLERYLMTKAPELFKTCKVDKLLRLQERGYKITQYKDYIKIGKLYVTHDVGKAGANAHNDARDTFEGNVVIGHTHRVAFAVKGNVKGKPHFGVMGGHMSDVAKADYMFKAKAQRDWALGFTTAYVDEAPGTVWVQPHVLVDYSVVIEGEKLAA